MKRRRNVRWRKRDPRVTTGLRGSDSDEPMSVDEYIQAAGRESPPALILWALITWPDRIEIVPFIYRSVKTPKKFASVKFASGIGGAKFRTQRSAITVAKKLRRDHPKYQSCLIMVRDLDGTWRPI